MQQRVVFEEISETGQSIRIVDLQDKWSDGRCSGTGDLLVALRDTTDISSLQRHLPQLLSLVDDLVNIAVNVQVVLTTLEIVHVLVDKLGERVDIHLPAVLNSMTVYLDHNNLTVRTRCHEVLHVLMRHVAPDTVLTLLQQPNPKQQNNSAHRTANYQENVLSVVIAALLTFPSSSFNLLRLAELASLALVDPRRKLRQAALECLALIGQGLGSAVVRLDPLWHRLENAGYEGVALAVQTRLQRRQLPRLTDQALVQYWLQLPQLNSRTNSGYRNIPEGADVDWIMQGQGPTSAGSGSSSSDQSSTRPFPIGTNDSGSYHSRKFAAAERKLYRAKSDNALRSVTAVKMPTLLAEKDTDFNKWPQHTAQKKQGTTSPGSNASSVVLENRMICHTPTLFRHYSHNDLDLRHSQSSSCASSADHSIHQLTPRRFSHSASDRVSSASLDADGGVVGNVREPSLEARENRPLQRVAAGPDFIPPLGLGNSSSKSDDHSRFNNPVRGVGRARSDRSYRGAPSLSPTTPNFSSDEDGHSSGAATVLSDSTRSKAKLLAKRNQFRLDMERKTQQKEQLRLHGRRSYGMVNDGGGASGVQTAVRKVNSDATGARTRRSISQDRTVLPKRPAWRGLDSSDSVAPVIDSSTSHLPRRHPAPVAGGTRASAVVTSTRITKSRTFRSGPAETTPTVAQGSAVNLFEHTMGAFEDPRVALGDVYVKLAAPDWEVIVAGLTDIVRLVRYHPSTVSCDIKAITTAVVQQCRNLRSQVMRAAIQTADQMFEHMGRAMEPEMSSLVEILLHRTGDTNRFIRSDSLHALETMLERLSPARAINVITQYGVSHRNSQVRCTAARLLCQLVSRLGVQRSLAPLPYAPGVTGASTTPATSPPGGVCLAAQLVPAAVQLVRQGDLHTRKYAKRIFQVWLQHPDLERILARYLSDGQQRDMAKLLESIQNESQKASAATPGSRTYTPQHSRFNHTV